jgi:hypothetical protein
MRKKALLALVITISIAQSNAFAQQPNNIMGAFPSLGSVVIEEVKLDCAEFKPNLITKFLWKEGPTRGILYKKCLDQDQDDQTFEKYNETMINDSNIGDLSKDIKDAKTKLTILTLTTALKNYLIDPETNADKMEMIKSAVESFKQHYVEKRAMIDTEIKSMKKNGNKRSKKELELISVIEDNEEDLGQSIDSTIKYMDFVLKDRHAFAAAHNKFLPKIYVEPKSFMGEKLSKYECDFLELNVGDKWERMKKGLQISCDKK